MNKIFLDLLKNADLNDYQKQLILFVTDEKYQSLYDNLATHAQIINKNNEWETVFFRTILQTQLDVVNGKINPNYVLSYVWQKVTTTMNAENPTKISDLTPQEFKN